MFLVSASFALTFGFCSIFHYTFFIAIVLQIIYKYSDSLIGIFSIKGMTVGRHTTLITPLSRLRFILAQLYRQKKGWTNSNLFPSRCPLLHGQVFSLFTLSLMKNRNRNLQNPLQYSHLRVQMLVCKITTTLSLFLIIQSVESFMAKHFIPNVENEIHYISQAPTSKKMQGPIINYDTGGRGLMHPQSTCPK